MMDEYRILVEIIVISLVIFGISYFRQQKKEVSDTEQITNILSSEVRTYLAELSKDSNESFLQLADQNFQKHQSTAQEKFDASSNKISKEAKTLVERLDNLEKDAAQNKSAFEAISTDLGEKVSSFSNTLQAWTQAMASNKVRGDLGEEALEKILEDSGLKLGTNYFKQQQNSIDGVTVKPDIVVQLANGGNLVIDSKFPYDDFKRAVEESDSSRQEDHYKKHAEAVLKHVKDLSSKNYFSYLNSSPEYTVLYLNSIIYYYHALRKIPDFFDQARKHRVIIATPEILIPLLSGVVTQWKEHKVMAEIGKVQNEVTELHGRLKTFVGHISDIASALGNAGSKVNAALSSFNSRVLPSIRRIEDFSQQTEKIEDLTIDRSLESQYKD